VKTALYIQDQIYQQGVACPNIYSVDGEYILTTPSHIHFSVMEVCEGITIEPGQATIYQMSSLGWETGKMHHALRYVVPGKLHWVPSKERIQMKWEKQYQLAQAEKRSDRVLSMLEQQKLILDQIDFTLFESCLHGWTHWDLHLDNVLFQGETVSVILDFDRMRYVYPELDVARAILSGCYSEENGMDEQKVAAFLEGYQEFFPDFQLFDLGRALQLIWTKESPWWLTSNIEERSEIPQRFFAEMEWLQSHWKEIQSLTR
jgi:Ser/Thr protein kinase RdoA (MazF antagonist)